MLIADWEKESHLNWIKQMYYNDVMSYDIRIMSLRLDRLLGKGMCSAWYDDQIKQFHRELLEISCPNDPHITGHIRNAMIEDNNFDLLLALDPYICEIPDKYLKLFNISIEDDMICSFD